MKKVLLIIGVVLVASLFAFWVFAPNNEDSTQTSTPTQNQSQTAVASSQNGTAFIYDVRTPEEFAVEHVEGAINFDVEKLKIGEMPDIPKESQVYVYCRSGNRSAEATVILKNNGFSKVTDLGGLDDLRNDGVL